MRLSLLSRVYNKWEIWSTTPHRLIKCEKILLFYYLNLWYWWNMHELSHNKAAHKPTKNKIYQSTEKSARTSFRFITKACYRCNVWKQPQPQKKMVIKGGGMEPVYTISVVVSKERGREREKRKFAWHKWRLHDTITGTMAGCGDTGTWQKRKGKILRVSKIFIQVCNAVFPSLHARRTWTPVLQGFSTQWNDDHNNNDSSIIQGEWPAWCEENIISLEKADANFYSLSCSTPTTVWWWRDCCIANIFGVFSVAENPAT